MSITLPRNFTFHYTEDEEPKTPEREELTPTAAPPSPQAYRLKCRSRPTIQTSTTTQTRLTQQLHDIPIPTIETPPVIETRPLRPSFQHFVTEPAEGYLAPVAVRPFMSLGRPRTPVMQRMQLSGHWNTPSQNDSGDSISRPLSRCSLASDSSDESSDSLTSYPSIGGSCTSPESDAPDPFVFPPAKHARLRSKPSRPQLPDMPNDPFNFKKQPRIQWTPEMDKHLWSTYTQYLQDPTVTPFKTLPGTAPPLGVCHRVTRRARRTWRGAGQTSRRNSEVTSSDKTDILGTSSISSTNNNIRTQEAISTAQGGSSTPTRPPIHATPAWPTSSSSTRRRLRYLAKRKPTIAPHYQRLLRSPSPFSSSPRPRPRSSRAFSPLSQEMQETPFSTRDIQLSLTTSTATTMQPNGPLAQLTHDDSAAPQQAPEWFNDPPVPWASPPAVPSSDLGYENMDVFPTADLPQLGSPFSGARTWGPSQSKQHVRPSAPRTQTSQTASTIGPALKSPFRFEGRSPYSSVGKRRAAHQLEDELSPGGSEKRTTCIEDLFRGHPEGRHRRVRSRGFSLGDVMDGASTERFSGEASAEQQTSQPAAQLPENNNLQPPNMGDSIKRLGSPFSVSGGGSMPSRRPSRHMASASLSAYDPGNFASIDGRIRQSDLSEDFLRRLRE
ncbi:MAG: hypothetical protein Q9220_000660 [cf. Caloplaca sp. 1 TL-2023]